MYKVIVFGTGKASQIVESALKNEVNIICYCDNNKEKWDELYNNKIVINPLKIRERKFDYVIIASQFEDIIYNQLLNLEIDSTKIFQFYNYMDSYNYILTDLELLGRHKNDIEGIATGISYTANAIDENILNKKVLNIAHPSQDLYFDYHLIKYILKNYKKDLKHFKFVFIGLSYYSFEYDMSMTSMKGKAALYYEAIGIKHNFNNVEKKIKNRNINRKIAKKIFNLHKNGYPVIDLLNNVENVSEISERNAKTQALLDCNKNYLETVKENKQILKKYLNLLTENNIKPIVIVCPVSEYYAKYFSQRLKDQFTKIIEETRKEYNFQFIDYFNSDLFKNEDFYDVSHLNNKGAEKFTTILNKIVEW